MKSEIINPSLQVMCVIWKYSQLNIFIIKTLI